MKKIFTLFAAAMLSISSFASTTFTFLSEGTDTQTKDEISIALAKGSGNNAPVFNTNYNQMRLYANNTITVSGAALSRISLTFTKQGDKAYATLSANSGNLTSGGESTGTEDYKVDIWTGSASSVTFTLGASGQRVIKQIVVNGDASDDEVPSVPGNPDVPAVLDPDYIYAEPTIIGVNSKAVQGDAYSFVDNNILVSSTKGAVTSDYFSAHAGFDITFTATKPIKGIVINGFVKKDFTATASSGNISYITPSDDKAADPVVVITDVNSTSVTISCVKQLRCYEVEVYFNFNPEATIGGGSIPGGNGGNSGETVTSEYDSAEIIYESFYTELLEEPNFSIFLFNAANYDFPYVALDIYPRSENDITGTYSFSDYTLGEITYYQYGESEDDCTYAVDGEATVKKKGTSYKIEGFITCNNGVTYEFSYTGVPDFYSDNQYYYDEEDGWIWNDQASDSPDFDNSGSALVNTVEQGYDAEAPMYDLMGRQVRKGYRGIYIQNGKKKIAY